MKQSLVSSPHTDLKSRNRNLAQQAACAAVTAAESHSPCLTKPQTGIMGLRWRLRLLLCALSSMTRAPLFPPLLPRGRLSPTRTPSTLLSRKSLTSAETAPGPGREQRFRTRGGGDGLVCRSVPIPVPTGTKSSGSGRIGRSTVPSPTPTMHSPQRTTHE